MEGPDWAGISKNAKILIKQMLTLDQSKRITAQEVRIYRICDYIEYNTIYYREVLNLVFILGS